MENSLKSIKIWIILQPQGKQPKGNKRQVIPKQLNTRCDTRMAGKQAFACQAICKSRQGRTGYRGGIHNNWKNTSLRFRQLGHFLGQGLDDRLHKDHLVLQRLHTVLGSQRFQDGLLALGQRLELGGDLVFQGQVVMLRSSSPWRSRSSKIFSSLVMLNLLWNSDVQVNYSPV